MKNCKFCNAELPEDTTVCPACGKDNAVSDAAASGTDDTARNPVSGEGSVPTDTTPGGADSAPAAPASEEGGAGKQTLSPGKTVLAIAAVVAVVILAAGALLGLKSAVSAQEAEIQATEAPAEAQTTAPTETEPPTVPPDGNPEDASCKGTYTAEDEAVISARDKVVATAGEHELTLAQLQVYYWMEVRNFMSQYGSYASYFGLDISQSLDTQLCPVVEESRTWQQYFLQAALNTWASYRAMAAEAEVNGFEISEIQRQALQDSADELDESAKANGYASAEALVHSSLGAAAELEDYLYFMELYYMANGYYSLLANQFQPTEAELEEYYDEHADGYEASGITRDLKSVDVRHILFYPEGADGTNIFTEEFGEEAWAAGQASANAVLEEFLAGEQTEERFGELANQHSQDPGSNQNGGLYEGVTQGEMVEPFDDWCFDETRQPGDTGIVKTDYGYHVMYYCGSAPVWQQYVESDFVTEKANALSDEIVAQCPLTVQYGDILLANAVLN